MGVDSGETRPGAQPIVGFDWPYRSVLWTSEDCSTSYPDNDLETQLCFWTQTDYSIDLVLEPGQTDNLTLAPDASANVAMTLIGVTLPGGGDTVHLSASETP
jgi:hypothetical protein